MKILFFNSGFPPSKGGVATYSYEWVMNTAANSEVEQTVVIAFGNPLPRRERITDKLIVYAFASRNFFFIGLAVLWYFLKYWSYDFFHATNLFPVGFWTVFWSKILFKKSIVTFYGTDGCATRISSKSNYLRAWTIAHASRAIAVSHFTKNETMARLHLKRKDIQVIYPGVPKNILCENYSLARHQPAAEKIKKDFKITVNDFIILSISQLVKRKGIEYLIRAISLSGDKSIKLIILGKGPERDRLKQLINQLHLSDRVMLAGMVEHALPYYLVSKLVAMVSYYDRKEGDFEGLGLVLLEAQSLGIPVIGTKSGGIPEAIQNQISGYLIPEQDPAALLQKIERLKNNPELYKLMSAKGKEFMSQKFDPAKNISLYIQWLKDDLPVKQWND